MALHQSTQRETKMQGEKMSVVMELTAQWVHEPACPAKTIKVFLCALCGLWCNSSISHQRPQRAQREAEMQGKKMGAIMKNIAGAEVSVQYARRSTCVVKSIIENHTKVFLRVLRDLWCKSTKINFTPGYAERTERN